MAACIRCGSERPVRRPTALLLIFLLGGCSRGVVKENLPGVYAFEGDGLKQEITLKLNGEYLNSLYSAGVLSWTDSGNWTYEQHSGKSGVTFVKFRFGLKGYSERPGFWFVVPEKTITGHRLLCFDPDLNRCFQAP